MKISYDPAKREWTLLNRGLDFHDVPLLFEGMVVSVDDTRKDYGEVRTQTIGCINGRMMMVVWSARSGMCHVISMRKCNAREQRKYGRIFAKAGGPSGLQ